MSVANTCSLAHLKAARWDLRCLTAHDPLQETCLEILSLGAIEGEVRPWDFSTASVRSPTHGDRGAIPASIVLRGCGLQEPNVAPRQGVHKSSAGLSMTEPAGLAGTPPPRRGDCGIPTRDARRCPECFRELCRLACASRPLLARLRAILRVIRNCTVQRPGNTCTLQHRVHLACSRVPDPLADSPRSTAINRATCGATSRQALWAIASKRPRPRRHIATLRRPVRPRSEVASRDSARSHDSARNSKFVCVAAARNGRAEPSTRGTPTPGWHSLRGCLVSPSSHPYTPSSRRPPSLKDTSHPLLQCKRELAPGALADHGLPVVVRQHRFERVVAPSDLCHEMDHLPEAGATAPSRSDGRPLKTCRIYPMWPFAHASKRRMPLGRALTTHSL